MARTQLRRVHEPDGVYEEELGVVSRRKLPNATVAVDTVTQAIRAKREQFYCRAGTHDTNDLDREVAIAVVESLIAAHLLTP